MSNVSHSLRISTILIYNLPPPTVPCSWHYWHHYSESVWPPTALIS